MGPNISKCGIGSFKGGQMVLREYPEVLEGSRKSDGSYGLPNGSMGFLMDSRESKKDV